MENKTQAWGISVTIIVVLIIAAVGITFFTAEEKAPKSEVAILLEKEAKAMNKRSPMKIHKNLRLDSVNSLGDKFFVTHYTVMGIKAKNQNKTYLKEFFEPKLVKGLRANWKIVANDVVAVYHFRNYKGELLMTSTITPERVKNEMAVVE